MYRVKKIGNKWHLQKRKLFRWVSFYDGLYHIYDSQADAEAHNNG